MCPVQIMKCCSIDMAGVWNLHFHITTEVLFCVHTRSGLITLLAQMMLQAEVPGLDAGKPGFGAGELWSRREESFSQSCASLQSTENKSYLLSRHAICLSTCWRGCRDGFLRIGYSNWWEETFKRFFASELQLKILWMVFLAAISKVKPQSVRCRFLAVTWRHQKVFSHLELLGLSVCWRTASWVIGDTRTHSW